MWYHQRLSAPAFAMLASVKYVNRVKLERDFSVDFLTFPSHLRCRLTELTSFTSASFENKRQGDYRLRASRSLAQWVRREFFTNFLVFPRFRSSFRNIGEQLAVLLLFVYFDIRSWTAQLAFRVKHIQIQKSRVQLISG
jgi:hypothetical protein